MAHGYMREFDEERGGERERRRDEDRERGWRGDQGEWNERDRTFMFGDRGHGQRDYERGFSDRSSDRYRDFRGDQGNDWMNRDRGTIHYGREHGYGGFQSDYSRRGREQSGFGGQGDWERSPRNFSSQQDDHYMSWRNKQMDALDRDYADYCREREQQFHQEFDTWRSRRRTNPEPLQAGRTQTGQPGDVSSTLELTGQQEIEPAAGRDPADTATLGTTTTGRNRR